MTIRVFEIVDQVLSYHPEADIPLLEKAYVFAARTHNRRLVPPERSYLDHPIGVAEILARMRLDEESIVAGLLHACLEQNLVTPELLDAEFGPGVSRIVQGVEKLSRLDFSRRKERQSEYVRKMIFALSEDIRVVLVKLADRLHEMRLIRCFGDAELQSMAEETLEIYAPLAARLGIEWMRLELEDLSFRCLHPDSYEEIIQGLARTEEERRRIIADIGGMLRDKLENHGLEVMNITGRPKRPYSIYKKMVAQQLELDRIHDLIAFRVILDTVKDCYEALALFHAEWEPVAGRFKDYIAKPKSNRYQSIHTTVVGPHGERMEIQMRTAEMDRIAREGIAAHWLYKEGKYLGKVEDQDTQRFSWLRHLLDWKRDWTDPKEFLDALKVNLYPNEVYVFTPQGEIKVFPKGATPIDFAYEIHTQVGHQCTGARVNGKLAPLRYELQNGDTIEIVTAARQHPSKDWLKFVQTTKARERIRRWVKTQERERSMALGKEICEREFRKKGLNFSHYINSPELEEVAASLSFRNIGDLLASIGYRKLSPVMVIGKLSPPALPEDSRKDSISVEKSKAFRTSQGVRIQGIDDPMVRLAKCCNPLPGEEIVGYITRGRGVTVHRTSCRNMHRDNAERQIEVLWDVGDGHVHPVDIQVTYSDDKRMLAVLSALLSQLGVNVVGVRMDSQSDGLVVCHLRVEVKDTDHLHRVLAALRGEKNVFHVQRSME